MVATLLPKVFVFDVHIVTRWQRCCQLNWQQRYLVATVPPDGNDIAILVCSFCCYIAT